MYQIEISPFVLNIPNIVEKTVELHLEGLSNEEIIKHILEIGVLASKSSEKSSLKEKKPKMVKEITEDEKCMARTFFEPDHSINGYLKIMRDDPLNLYADRCKRRKVDDCNFCRQHKGNQTLGVWNGEYRNRLLDAVNKTLNAKSTPSKDKAKKGTTNKEVGEKVNTKKEVSEKVNTKKEKDKRTMKKDLGDFSLDSLNITDKADKKKEVCLFEDEEVKLSNPSSSLKITLEHENKEVCLFEDEEETPSNPSSSAIGNLDDGESESDETIEIEPIIIDDKKYYIDPDNNLYSENEECIGKFEHKTGKIIYN